MLKRSAEKMNLIRKVSLGSYAPIGFMIALVLLIGGNIFIGVGMFERSITLPKQVFGIGYAVVAGIVTLILVWIVAKLVGDLRRWDSINVSDVALFVRKAERQILRFEVPGAISEVTAYKNGVLTVILERESERFGFSTDDFEQTNRSTVSCLEVLLPMGWIDDSGSKRSFVDLPEFVAKLGVDEVVCDIKGWLEDCAEQDAAPQIRPRW